MKNIKFSELTEKQISTICKRHKDECFRGCPFRFFLGASSICLKDFRKTLKIDAKIVLVNEDEKIIKESE